MTFTGTMGGLFEGVGGFGLAAERIGLDPLWSSEIEPSALKVLDRHFPDTRQLGDITGINARSAEHVDIITGGSPCQGFSIAGVGLGMDDPRSGLFGEMIRVMHDLEPRWLVWENVPGVLTSNKGEDFANALAAFVGASAPLHLPRHPNGRRGRYAGLVSGPLGTAAWRVLDAQHFGVPQRRRRIFAVVHLGGDGAGEVLLERQGSDGDSHARGPQGDAGQAPVAPARRADPGGGGLAPILMRQREGKPGGGKGPLLSTDSSLTLATGNDQYLFEPQPFVEPTDTRVVVEGFPSPAGTLTTRYHKGVNTTMDDGAIVIEVTVDGTAYECIVDGDSAYRVRRLMPKEGERLQGFPDGWTSPAGSDASRWKAIGNAVAVPVAEWVLRRILDHEARA